MRVMFQTNLVDGVSYFSDTEDSEAVLLDVFSVSSSELNNLI